MAARPTSVLEVRDVLDDILSHWNDSVVQPQTQARRMSPATSSTNVVHGKGVTPQTNSVVAPPTRNVGAAAPAHSFQPPARSLQSSALALPLHVTIFSLFAREDIQLVTDIQAGLEGALRRTTRMSFYDQLHITAGSDHKEYMENALTTADIVLLFVSASFLASDSCSFMADRALLRHQQGDATVVPIVVRPCSYTYSSFSNLPMHPQDRRGKVQPITSWSDRDAAMVKVIDALTQLLADLHMQGQL